MRRKIDISQVLKDFEGEPMKRDPGDKDSEDLTIKSALLVYYSSVNRMNKNREDEGVAYECGILVGSSKKEVIFSTSQYDLTKKLVDDNKVKMPGGQEEPIYGVVVNQGLKNIIDSAEVIKEKGKK